MQKTITMTSKGTFTMPIAIRKKLGVSERGDRLLYTFDPDKQQMIIEKPKADFSAIHEIMTPYVEKAPPLKDIRAFLNTRKPRI